MASSLDERKGLPFRSFVMYFRSPLDIPAVVRVVHLYEVLDALCFDMGHEDRTC